MEEALRRVAAWTNGPLDLSELELDELPPLPDGLTHLLCVDNNLRILPALLPATLIELDCSYNNLLTLHTPSGLPASLEKLICDDNNLVSLPRLPAGLLVLSFSSNEFRTLPRVPASLTRLNCSYNELTTLPDLPATLRYLSCINNQLTSLPDLPAGLTQLNCSDNKLTSLPVLPATLTELSCRFNKLTSLPDLPAGLTKLWCTKNNLTVYPDEDEPIKTYEARLRIAEEKHRSIARCRTLMEELMIVCWSPDRLDRLIASYPDRQWNHVLHAYGPFTAVTMDEIL
jgi:Leucine-rich repeat (LRR) protein